MWAAALVLLAGAVTAAGLVAWGVHRFNQIELVDVPGVDPSGESAANWLLVGTDSREGIDPDDPDAAVLIGEPVPGRRTDTIMVVRVDRDRGTVDLLSVPRDLWVTIDGRDEAGRINGAYNGDDGRRRLAATVETALGIDINHYAEIDLVGFREVVDAVEGVPVWFEHPTRDLGSGLDIVEAGCHLLDGRQALAYVRSRTWEEQVDGQWRLDPTGDLGRTARQRLLLSAIVEAVGGSVGPTGLFTLDRILAVGGRNVVLEDGTGLGSLIGLARTFASVGGSGVVGHSLPVADHRTGGGAQVLLLQEDAAGPVLDRFRSGHGSDGDGADALAATTPEASEAGLEEASGGSDVAVVAATGPAAPPGSSGYGGYGFQRAVSPDGTACG